MKDNNNNTYPFIGRTSEIAAIQNLITDVKNGKSNVVFISGDAGVGKTKLVEILMSTAEQAGIQILITDCNPHTKSSPYQPFLDFANTISTESASRIFEFERYVDYSEIFVVNSAGLLITHLSKKPLLGKDKKIMSGMLTAIQDYISSALASDTDADVQKAVYKFEYGDKCILISRSSHLYIACVLEGEEQPDMRIDIQNTIANIELKYGDVLDSWSGDLSLSNAIKSQVVYLFDKKYVITKIEDIRAQEYQIQICDKICTIFQNYTSVCKTVLVIENLQWMDDASIKVLEYLCRLVQLGILKNTLICCTYRPSEVCQTVKDMVAVLTEKECIKIDLKPFEKEEIIHLITTIYDVSNGNAAKFSAMLLKMTGGNPLFINTLLQKFSADKYLFVKNRRLKYDKNLMHTKLPENLCDFILDKVMQSPESLRYAEYAVTIGEPFSVDLLADAMQIGVKDAQKNLNALVSIDILAQKDGKYMVSKPIVFNAIYDNISERWKKIIHRNIGYALEKTYSHNIEKVVFQLAHHFLNTIEHRKAFEYNLRAAEASAKRYALQSSVKFYENALSTLAHLDTETQKQLRTQLLEKIGDAYAATGAYDVAIKYMKDAMACGPIVKHAEFLYKIGRFYGKLGRYKDAIDHLQDGLNVDTAANAIKCKLYNELGWIYQRESRYDDALSLHMSAAKFVKKGDLKNGALTNSYIGFVYWYKGDCSKAIKFLKKSHAMLIKINDKHALANNFNNIGVILQQEGKYDEALTYFLKSYRLRKKLNDIYGLSASYTNLGNVYLDTGNTKKALINHKKALEIRLKINDIYGQSVAHNNLAKTLLVLDRWKGASTHIETSLKLKQQLADKRGEAIAHIIAACISLEKCIYSDVSLSEKLRETMLKTSIERLNKSVAICNEIQEKWLLAINYHLLTEAYTKMHDYKNALKTSEKALKLAKEVTAADIEAECYRSIAVLDCALKKWSRAKTNFEKCIKMLSRLNEKVELGKTFYEYALLFKNKNDTKSCIKYLMKAAKIFKEVGATKKLKHINKMYQEEMCQKGV